MSLKEQPTSRTVDGRMSPVNGMPTVKLFADARGRGVLIVDGHEIAVTGVELNIEAQRATNVRMSMLANVEIELVGHEDVYLFAREMT